MTWAVAAAVAAVAAGPAAAQTQEDPASEAAERLLTASVTLGRGGEHNRLLRSLRTLKDPALRPMFQRLASHEHPALRIHGILGLAETADPPRLDLDRLAELEQPEVEYELVGAALDEDLLSVEDAKAVLGWRAFNPPVKLALAGWLIEEGRLGEAGMAVLAGQLDSDKASRQAVAALWLAQLGDERGPAALGRLLASEDPQRELIIVDVLKEAIRREANAAAAWAYAVSRDERLPDSVRRDAVGVAMRFGQPQAVRDFVERYRAADIGEKYALALMALSISPFVPPETFDPVAATDDAFLKVLATTAAAVARGDEDVADHVVRLIDQQHGQASLWALRYATERASPDDGRVILLKLIYAAVEGGRRGQQRRQAAAVEATRDLFNLSPEAAAPLLRPMLTDPKSDVLVKQAVLLGLIRSDQPGAGELVADLPPLADRGAYALLVLLKARSGLPLNEDEMAKLRLIVRGGESFDDALRVQAAWSYLKRTGDAEAALQRALDAAS